MRRTLTLLLALIALVALLALTRPARAQLYPACDAEGYPGGWYAYCLSGELVAWSWAVPDGTVDYMVCGLESAQGRRHVLRPSWLHLQTRETQPMPEAEPWHIAPTTDQPCARLRFAAAWPGELWVPDLEVLEPARVYLPLVRLGARS
jgi:hypothetical protein